ncbi:MAG TPA: hypothetical protein VLV86_10615 [Vicinamibacterales bacterium]|nr:hypothetical protein [Vicinamibacterales bacterium]
MRQLGYAAVLAVVLGAIATMSPLPDRVTDRAIYERTAAVGVVPDCNDLHCFRALVAWTLGMVPAPSVLKWRAYSVACNAAAAVFVLQLGLTFGLSERAAWTASLLSALGFGALYTLHDAYTSDPLMYAIGPLMMNELLRGRYVVAGAIGTVGGLAKEFAVAPLFLFSMYEAVERRWPSALRTLVAANTAFIVWALFHLTMIIRFNYGYGGTTSTRFLSGGGVGPWLEEQSLRGVLSAMFNEFGALYVLAPLGFARAPQALRRLTVVAAPIAAVLCYVQQPDRALWNFHFLVTPLAAVALDRAPLVLASLTVGAFVVANLRVGAQLMFVPAARFALAASVVLAAAVIGQSFRPALHQSEGVGATR